MPGPGDPTAGRRGRGPGGDFPVGLRTRGNGRAGRCPPARARPSAGRSTRHTRPGVGLPTIERVAPELAVRAEVVRRDAGNDTAAGPGHRAGTGRGEPTHRRCPAPRRSARRRSAGSLGPGRPSRSAAIGVSNAYWTNSCKAIASASSDRASEPAPRGPERRAPAPTRTRAPW